MAALQAPADTRLQSEARRDRGADLPLSCRGGHADLRIVFVRRRGHRRPEPAEPRARHRGLDPRIDEGSACRLAVLPGTVGAGDEGGRRWAADPWRGTAREPWWGHPRPRPRP